MAILRKGVAASSKNITHACVLGTGEGRYNVISYHDNAHDAGVNAGITGGKVVFVWYENGEPVLVLS
jgi:hypothetical protein